MMYGYGRGYGYGGGYGWWGGGRGFGFRGASPPWPYVGRGRGGMPRCWYPGLYGPGQAPYPPYVPPATYGYRSAPTPEDELAYLREQADAIRAQMEEIERRIKELTRSEE